jgi:hypothetical protein
MVDDDGSSVGCLQDGVIQSMNATEEETLIPITYTYTFCKLNISSLFLFPSSLSISLSLSFFFFHPSPLSLFITPSFIHLLIFSAGCEQFAVSLHGVGQIDADLYIGTVPFEGGFNEIINQDAGTGNQTWGSDRYSKYSRIVY